MESRQRQKSCSSSWGAVHVHRGAPRLERSLCLQHQLQFGQLHETCSLVGAGPRAPLWVGAATQTPWHPCLQTAPQSVWAIAISPPAIGVTPGSTHTGWEALTFREVQEGAPSAALRHLSYPDKLIHSTQRCPEATAREPSPPALQAPSAPRTPGPQHRPLRCFLTTAGKSVLVFSEFLPPNYGSGTKQVPSKQGFDS